MDTEFTEMLKSFDVSFGLVFLYVSSSLWQGKETEHNWAPRDRAVTRVRGMLKGDVHVRYLEAFISHLKPFIDASLKTVSFQILRRGSFVTWS